MANEHPFPDLKVWRDSNLSFPWAEYHPNITGTFDASFGADGVAFVLVMLIRWEDLPKALVEILGYSWRDVGNGAVAPRLRRILPWQHPYCTQLWAKRISKVVGIRNQGNSVNDPVFWDFPTSGNGAGSGYRPNLGPWSEFNLAQLTIQFWRPPYAVRTDSDIEDFGEPQEWKRYCDRNWNLSTQLLTREGSQFSWVDGSLGGKMFPGSVGQKVCKLKVTRRWYQIPEAAIFQKLADGTYGGLPYNILYTQTPTINPITGYTYTAGNPIPGCINSQIGGGSFPAISDTVDNSFFGCFTGTLLFEGVEFIPQDLQLPPPLMQIPAIPGGEPVSQIQYDVVFHFEVFDPVVGILAHGMRGYNLMPYAGNGLWYAVQSTQNRTFGPPNPFEPLLTPFMYADFTDLFTIL